MSEKVKLYAILALMLLSVIVDSAFYIVSFLTDAVILGAATWLMWSAINSKDDDKKKPS